MVVNIPSNFLVVYARKARPVPITVSGLKVEESWNSSTLAISCKEMTHWKRPWCWEGLGAGGEGDDRGWDGWMASPTWWTWVWVNSGSWGWTGRPGVLWFMRSQRVRHDWVTELNWTLSVGYILKLNDWFSVFLRSLSTRYINMSGSAFQTQYLCGSSFLAPGLLFVFYFLTFTLFEFFPFSLFAWF